MEHFDEMGDIFKRIVRARGWLGTTVDVRVKNLTAEEAIGHPEHDDYPLIKGRERMMEADFLGSRGQAFTDMYGEYSGTVAEVCDMRPENNFRRAIYIATLNAVARHMGLVSSTVHCKNDEPPLCAKELVQYIHQSYGRPKVALVGLQPRMVEALGRNFELRVTDMDADNVGTIKFGTKIEGPEKTMDNLAWCDLALVTGTTLTNNSIPEFLNGKPAIFYGVTIAGPALFLNLTRFCPYGS
ncbi:MAG: DUF364 domain-containing protein [Pseudomonadota bacterium]